MKIGIIGGGFIGEVLKKYYPQAKIYDKFKELDSLKETLDQEIIFIAFNLKDNGLKSYEEISEYAKKAPTGTAFIIKSTFVPGTTDKLQEEFPQHIFIYNPEFLTELTAWEDFTKPIFQILGMPHQALPVWKEIFDILPDAPIKRIISPLDAELLKHAKNSYYALKVTFFNQLYDAAKEIGADYETVREILTKDPWIGDSHSLIFHKGYRGYDGKCLSKDPKMLAKVAKFPLIDHIEKYNGDLRTQ
jgi:UDP-glucose 6-dehydrogenase